MCHRLSVSVSSSTTQCDLLPLSVSSFTTQCVILYHSVCHRLPLSVSPSITQCVIFYHSGCHPLPLSVLPSITQCVMFYHSGCCCLPTPMTLASGGSPMFPVVVHQLASPSIWPAVQSLRRGTTQGVILYYSVGHLLQLRVSSSTTQCVIFYHPSCHPLPLSVSSSTIPRSDRAVVAIGKVKLTSRSLQRLTCTQQVFSVWVECYLQDACPFDASCKRKTRLRGNSTGIGSH